jgi:hypothetical protein
MAPLDMASPLGRSLPPRHDERADPMSNRRIPRWLQHPVRTFLDWLGGLVIDRVFAHEDELRRIAVYNEIHAQERAAEELRAAYWATAGIPDVGSARDVIRARADHIAATKEATR